MKRRKRAKPGDILKLATDNGYAYVQYIGEHVFLGEAIAVPPRIYDQPQDDWRSVFVDAYVTFYALQAALSQELAEIVANTPPVLEVPRRMRGIGLRGEWWIEEAGPAGEYPGREYPVQRLSDDERRLPIGAIWGHPILVDRMAEGWRPEHEGTAERAIPDPFAQANRPDVEDESQPDHVPDPAQPLRHYLYFRSEHDAERATDAARQAGWQAEWRLAADGQQWLLLVSHRASEMQDWSARLEALAKDFGGEYDGSELQVAELEK
jgi:hypothetical protein